MEFNNFFLKKEYIFKVLNENVQKKKKKKATKTPHTIV